MLLDANAYEVLSLAMRYFFTFFGVMIVWRAFSWLRKDRKAKHKRLRQLPDAGTIGILTVETGSNELPEGSMIPVPHEGCLGYLRTCDMVVPAPDVANVHLDFTFVDGKGLYVYPRRGCGAVVDGIPLRHRRDCKRYPMQHGSSLQVGQAVLRLGVFAGLDVKEAHLAPFIPEDAYDGGEACVPDLPVNSYWTPVQGNAGQAGYPPQGGYVPPSNPQRMNPPEPYGSTRYQQPWQGGGPYET